ncbi:M23 family metallopeptidase [Tsuneonella sp. YG55]|uniref:M23 family metallopeptidase n=1 Tax=Tsuneonella litorea TaxID=2976475 RepID=A0A9X2W4B0_9SPHN|nr:M23 family metallopeptidase [Tsuneonella litorea]MCT2559391.1 M23 family metallopeptidase [Tsuneonella litorea]
MADEVHPQAAVISIGSGGGAASITVSKASDALGAPIALRRHAKGVDGAADLEGTRLPSGLPVSSRAVTSRFGFRQHPVLRGVRMHSGVDLAAPMGSPVVSAADGVVAFASWNGSYGLLVKVEHGGGYESRFAHLSRILVSPGQRVSRGQLVGLVGSTGRSTGAHLHYEVRKNGLAIDPLKGR